MDNKSDKKPEPADPPEIQAKGSIWSELKRRHVIRVAGVYGLVGWLIIQIASATFSDFGIPSWAFRLIVLMVLLGFPISLIIAWAFELTPEGIKTTRSARQSSEASSTFQTKRKRFSMLFAMLVPSVIFGSLALFFFLQARKESAPIQPIQEANRTEDLHHSIAVLPLLNLSAVADNAHFAGGVHEDILTNLSRIDGMRVVSRTSAARFINSQLSLKEIGADLNARFILEGSVRRIQNHVRVSVQLIDAVNDAHMWARNYDRELLDVFATQSAVAKEISNSVLLAIQPDAVGSLTDMPTFSVKAYDLYMKAKSIDRSEPESESSLTRQAELLEAAALEDPDFVEAWAFLNEVYDHSIRQVSQSGWFLETTLEEDTVIAKFSARAKVALNKAVTLDSENLETLLAQASDSVAERDEAFRKYRKTIIDKAVTKYPDDAIVWYVLGWWYDLDGNEIAAKPAFEKALELDPLNARIIYGSLIHFRNVADKEMTDYLFDRLAQIAPEMGKDKSLKEISLPERIASIFDAFRRTADQSLIGEMSDLLAPLAAREESSFHRSAHAYYSSEIMELNNELASLQEVHFDPVENDRWSVQSYFMVNLTALAASKIAGNLDNAKTIARNILAKDTLREIVADGNLAATRDAAYAYAYGTLGETDKAKPFVDKLLNERDESYNAYGVHGYATLIETEPDKAVAAILQEKARHPTWFGTDLFAAKHVTFRAILVHPEMQRFYLNDKKWIPYLGERVPEYEKYQVD